MHMTSTDWAIFLGVTAIIFFLGAVTKQLFGFFCFYMMLLSLGIYIVILIELTGEASSPLLILMFLGIVPYSILIMRFFYRLFCTHNSRKSEQSTKEESATSVPKKASEPRTKVTIEISGCSDRVFFDGKGYLRNYGDCYFDSKGYLRSPGDMFFDGKGYLRSPGDAFFDSKGYLRSPGDMFFDGEGYLR